MKKKLLSLTLALMLCLGLAIPAAAETLTMTVDSIAITANLDGIDGTASYTGTGELTREVLLTGLEMLAEMGTGELDIGGSFTINIGSGITVSDNIRELFAKIGKSLADEGVFFGVNYSDVSTPTAPTAPSTPVDQTVGNFTDVKTSDYFAEPVAWAVDKGITAGTSATTFGPNSTCVQAQILTFLWRACGSPNPAAAVSGSEYYAIPFQWAREQDIISSSLDPDSPCTRADVVTYLWKLAGSPKDVPASSASSASFSDVSPFADYATAVSWAVIEGITAGTSPTTFSPDSICTRGQIVTFLYAALAK